MQRVSRRSGDRAAWHLWRRRNSSPNAAHASNVEIHAAHELRVPPGGRRCSAGSGNATLGGLLERRVPARGRQTDASLHPEPRASAGRVWFRTRFAVPPQAHPIAWQTLGVAAVEFNTCLRQSDLRRARLSFWPDWTANVVRAFHTDVGRERSAGDVRRQESPETECALEKAEARSASSTPIPSSSEPHSGSSSHESAPKKDGDSSNDIGKKQGNAESVRGAIDVQKLTAVEEDELRRRSSSQVAAILRAALDDGNDEDEKVEVEFQRSLTVGIVGAPNAGKSLLTNKLVGSRVSAVSCKTNTTHREHMAAYTKGDTQLLYYDTPGLHLDVEGYPLRVEAKNRVRNAWEIADFCEVLVVLVDAERQIRKPDKRVERLVDKLGKEQIAGQKKVLCLNKVDIIEPKRLLLPLAKQCEHLLAYDRIFMISGLTGSGVNDVRDYLLNQSVIRPWDEDPDLKNHRDIALEIVREHIFERLHEELPHTTMQKLVSWKVLKDGSIRIQQQLLVGKKEHQKMLVGRNGAVIGEIGIKARKELQEILGSTVHLILDVLVQPDAMYREKMAN